MSRLTASSMSACVDGPNARPLGEPDEPLQLGREVEDAVGSSGATRWLTSATAIRAGLEADLLLAVLVDDVVLAVLAGAAGLAVADVGAGEVLELERDVLGDVAHPGALAQPGDEPAAPAERAGVVLERRQQRDQRVGEARDLVRREVLEDAEVDEHPDDRLARPVVRAAQDPGLEDAQGRQRLAPAAGGRCRLGDRRVASRGVRASVRRSRSRWRSVRALAVSVRRGGLAATRPRPPGSAWRTGVDDPLAAAQVEAVAGGQRMEHDAADHQRPVAADLPGVGLGARAVDDGDRSPAR